MLVIKNQHHALTLVELVERLLQQAFDDDSFFQSCAALKKTFMTILQKLVKTFDGFTGIGLKERVIFLFFQPGEFKDFFILWRSSKSTCQLANGVADFMRLLAHLAWPPVLSPKLIENRATDAQGCEAAK